MGATKKAGSVSVLLVAALAMVVTSSRAARGISIGVSVLQATPDSVQIEMAWTPGSSNRPITGYGLLLTGYIGSIEATPVWTRTDTVGISARADTLWVPQDTTDRPATACVRTLTSTGKSSDFSCTSFTVPSQVIVTPPGPPEVRIISAIGMTFDSLQINEFADEVQLRSLENLDMIEGTTFLMGAMGWKHTAAGPIAFTCVRFDTGQQGWKEMRLNEVEGLYTDPPGGLFIPDPGCGFAWYSTNPAVATVAASNVPLGELTMIDVAVVQAVPAGPRPIPLPTQAL